MRRVQRWRYYCDFCKKAGNSGGHMKKHEASCTLNPQRTCGMCAVIEADQADMTLMLALLPDPKPFESVVHHDADVWGGAYDENCFDSEGFNAAMAPALKALRELTTDCPACILAALRQKGIPVPAVEGFDFKDELKEFWTCVNDAEAEREGYYG
jgi:hypothetical protein